MTEELLSLVNGRRGHFLFESGHHGDRWMDLETLCLRSSAVRPLAAELAERLRKYEVEAVCGPLVEGAFIALLVSLDLACEFVYAERIAHTGRKGLFPVEYRVPKSLHAAVRGKRVAVANDVISAGSAVRGTFADLQAIGARVVAIGALLGMGDSITRFANEQNTPLELLEQMPHHLWTPIECPLCAAGMKLEIVATS